MLNRYLVAIALIFCSIKFSNAQQFSLRDAGMVHVGRSFAGWFDYDNDGDLDAVISGDHGSGPYIAAIYRNDAGNFTNINAGLTGIYNSFMACGDYDADGDYDIIACGRNSSNSKTYLYTNQEGIFTGSSQGLPNIGSDGALAWGDYDGDNDLDLLIGGAFSTKILRNDAGVFTDIGASLPSVSNCWLNWGDFDNDADLDIFVMGDLGGILLSKIYFNDQGTFSEAPQSEFIGLTGGSASWCDYDHDLDADLLISGFNEYLEPLTTIYRNDGNLLFSNTYPGLIGASLGSAAWADYNSDSEPDLLITGQNAGCGIMSSIIYRNDGNNQFTDINAPLDGAERGSGAWGDYDNDGDPDILINGINGSGTPATRLYSNNSGTNSYSVNQCPETPENLQTIVNAHQVSLSWSESTDDHTAGSQLTYNLRIGTISNGNDVMPSMSIPISGKRLIPSPGNAGNGTTWQLNLPDGNYYWSVQSVDGAYCGSAFAPEQSFTIANVGLNKPDQSGYKVMPNPFDTYFEITAKTTSTYELINAEGKIVLSGSADIGYNRVQTQHISPGFYTLLIRDGQKYSVFKIIKRS